VLTQVVESSVTSGWGFDVFVEPFAGGAATSLRLVSKGLVPKVVLGDADPMVASFWHAAAFQTDALIERMSAEHDEFVRPGGSVALGRWDHWKGWSPPAGASAASVRFERAVQCLFLNRTTFSGILHGRAGPIGGRSQTSPYKIGCRFNPSDLAERIRFVGYLADTGRIDAVWHADWQETLGLVRDRRRFDPSLRVLAYLDPPYFDKSQRLYATSFGSRAFPHVELARNLRDASDVAWLLSYDDQPELLGPDLYGGRGAGPGVSARRVRLSFSAAASLGRGEKTELLLTNLPDHLVPRNDRLTPVEARGR
jgi:DNA adenine methylase